MITELEKDIYIDKANYLRLKYGDDKADDMIFGMIMLLAAQGEWCEELEGIRRGCRPDRVDAA